MCNCFTVKVFVSNFKVEKVKTWTTLSTFLRFFDMTLQKNVKSRVFWIFKKRKERILEQCCTHHSTKSLNMKSEKKTFFHTSIEILHESI